MVGVAGIEPTVLFSDRFTVCDRTLRSYSRCLEYVTGVEPAYYGFAIRTLTIRGTRTLLVVLERIELSSNGYQPFALPLSYRTLLRRYTTTDSHRLPFHSAETAY